MLPNRSVLLLLAVVLYFEPINGASKCVWSYGQLSCKRNPKAVANVDIYLWDRDGLGIFQYIDPNDIMG